MTYLPCQGLQSAETGRHRQSPGRPCDFTLVGRLVRLEMDCWRSGFSFVPHNTLRFAPSLFPSLHVLGLKFHPQLLMSTLFSYYQSL
jgi:hypothetical protein